MGDGKQETGTAVRGRLAELCSWLQSWWGTGRSQPNKSLRGQRNTLSRPSYVKSMTCPSLSPRRWQADTPRTHPQVTGSTQHMKQRRKVKLWVTGGWARWPCC